nr:hypothetical protein [Nitrosopumilus sp.]
MHNVKIKSITVNGLRGIKKDIILSLDGKSIVLYGDNGSGKSSIADVMEWFYNNRIEHLSDSEIGRNGLEAMRHTELTDTDEGCFDIKFTQQSFDCLKKLCIKRGSVVSENSNCTPEFSEYLSQSENERILIRYRNLADFVLATKGERLTQLSQIIGFSEVTDTRKLLNKIYKKLDKEIKDSGFERIIQSNQQTLINNVKQNVVNEAQFILAINQLLYPYNPQLQIEVIADIDKVIVQLKKPFDQAKFNSLNILNSLKNFIDEFEGRFNSVLSDYSSLSKKYNEIIENVESLKNLKLSDLLTVGEEIFIQEPQSVLSCPLCLQDIDGVSVLQDIQKRLSELKKLKKEKLQIEDEIKDLETRLNDEIQQLKASIKNELLSQEKYKSLKGQGIEVGLDLKAVKDVINNADFNTKMATVIEFKSLQSCKKIKDTIETIITEIKNDLSQNSETDIIVKLQESVNAFKEIQKQKATQRKIETQRDSIQ